MITDVGGDGIDRSSASRSWADVIRPPQLAGEQSDEPVPDQLGAREHDHVGGYLVDGTPSPRWGVTGGPFLAAIATTCVRVRA